MKFPAKYSKLLAVIIAGGMLIFASAVAHAADLYVVYAGKDKDLKARVIKEVSPELQVKSYNIDLLALADYSGKQKVAAKLQQAQFIVFTSNRAKAPFESFSGIADRSAIINETDFASEISDIVGRLEQPNIPK